MSSAKKFLQYILIFVLVFGWANFFSSPWFNLASVSADNAFIDPNSDGTVAASQTTCGGGGNYDCLDEGTRSPTAPSTAGDYLTFGNNNKDFYDMATIGSISQATDIQIYVYHVESKTNMAIEVSLFDTDESTQYGISVDLSNRSSAQWDSVTFSSVNLSQTQLDNLNVHLKCHKIASGGPGNCISYAMYADVTHTLSGNLTVDIVDSGGTPVVSPSVVFSPATFAFDSATTTAAFGVDAERIRVDNQTATPSWTLTAAATSTTAVWYGGTAGTYDYNDSGFSEDGDDADALGGRLELDPSAGTVSPEGGCSSTGISKGSQIAFEEEVTDSITLLSANGSADTGCFWDFTGINLTQSIPASQSIGDYSFQLTLTVN